MLIVVQYRSIADLLLQCETHMHTVKHCGSFRGQASYIWDMEHKGKRLTWTIQPTNTNGFINKEAVDALIPNAVTECSFGPGKC